MQKSQPDFLNTIESTKNNVSANLYTHNIGRIVTFYPATQTADVELMQVKEYNGQKYSNTVLCDIPVIVYGSKDAQITLPDLTNTICLILTFDRNVSAFMKTGESYEASTSRKHNITDSIALTTFFSLNNPVQNYDNNAITLIYTAIISEIQYTSYIKNKANEVEINVNNSSTITITPTKATIETSTIENKADTITLKSDNGGQINVASLLTLKNSTTDLATVLEGLIDVIKAIKISGTTISDTSKNALDAYKTTIGALLSKL